MVAMALSFPKIILSLPASKVRTPSNTSFGSTWALAMVETSTDWLLSPGLNVMTADVAL